MEGDGGLVPRRQLEGIRWRDGLLASVVWRWKDGVVGGWRYGPTGLKVWDFLR